MALTANERERISAILSGPCNKSGPCAVKDILAGYGDKWTLFTVLLLGQSTTMRFNELRNSISGISQRMLTVTLRSLEEDGLIKRLLYPEVPPKVEYSLTPLGESLLKHLLPLTYWAEIHMAEILGAREKFRSKEAM